MEVDGPDEPDRSISDERDDEVQFVTLHEAKCVYCEFHEWLRHPKFIYFTTDQRKVNEESVDYEPVGDKHIGFSKQPFARINQQNRIKGYHTGSKSTNLHGPHWQPELLIGPFFHEAKRYKDEWRNSSRGMANRYKRALDVWKKIKADIEFCQGNNPRIPWVTGEYIVNRLEDRDDELAMKAKQLANLESVIPDFFCRDILYTEKVFTGQVSAPLYSIKEEHGNKRTKRAESIEYEADNETDE